MAGRSGQGSGRTVRPPASVRPSAGAARFRAGDRVRHATFGDGVVVASLARDGDEEVTVAFTGGAGIKKLMQQFARLQKV